VLGSPGDSLEVVLDGEKAGLWTDRATGDGGDIFALIAAHLGIGVLHDFPRVLDAPPICSVVPRKACAQGQQEGRTRRRTRPRHRQVGLPRRGRPSDRRRLPLRPARAEEAVPPWDAKRRKMAPPDPRPLYNQPGMPAPRRWCWSKARNARRP
jgi:putative DNA primase/helicase